MILILILIGFKVQFALSLKLNPEIENLINITDFLYKTNSLGVVESRNLIVLIEKFANLNIENLSEFETPLILLEKIEQNSDLSFFYKEFDLDFYKELEFSKLFRFICHYANVLVEIEAEISFKNSQNSLKISEKLNFIFEKKLSLPNQDYFFFFTFLETSASASKFVQKSELKELIQSFPFENEIRFKFGFLFNSDNFGSGELVNLDNLNIEDLYYRKSKEIINGKLIKVSAVNAGIIKFINNPDGTLKKGSGYLFEIVKALSLGWNFTLNIIAYSGTGEKLKNSSWVGGVGDIFNRKSHIAIPIGMSAQRYKAVDASTMINFIKRGFILRTLPSIAKWNSIFSPFDIFSWILIISTLIISIAFFYICIREPKMFSSIVTGVTGILLDQSWLYADKQNLRGVIRFLILTWTLFCLVLNTGYRGKLLVSLSFREPLTVPDTHKQLALSKYKIYFRSYGGLSYQHMATSEDTFDKLIFRRMVILNSTDSTHKCVEKTILNTKAACLDFTQFSDYVIYENGTINPRQDEMQKRKFFQKSNDYNILPAILVMALRKFSYLTETFNEGILWLIAFHLTQRWNYLDEMESKIKGAEWLKSQQKSQVKAEIVNFFKQDSGIGAKPLSINILLASFIIFAFGTFAAFLAFSCEFIIRQRQIRKVKAKFRKVFKVVVFVNSYIKKNSTLRDLNNL